MNTENEIEEIALFPLRSVLFPRGRLALQIFERRYIDLVTQSLRSDTGFGVVLLKSGAEVIQAGSRQTIHRTGTYVKIIDWDQLENGLLGITVEGLCKFQVQECRVGENGLFMAQVQYSNVDTGEDKKIPLCHDYHTMVDLLMTLEKHPEIEQLQLNIDHDNLWHLGWRLSELIPLGLETRQQLLELDDPRERMRRIEIAVQELAGSR
jgi:uncharacterized protein